MKFISLLLLHILVLTGSAAAQQEMRILPKWKLNESRSVKEENITKVYENGKYTGEYVETTYYTMTVIDTVETYTMDYVLRTGGSRNYINKKKREVEDLNELKNLYAEVEESMQSLHCQLKIDKSTGLATEIINADEMMTGVKAAINKIVIRICAEQNVEQPKQDSLIKVLDFVTDLQRPYLTQYAINSANTLLEVYSHGFLVGGEITYSVEFTPLEMIAGIEEETFDGTMKIRGVRGENRQMHVFVKCDYDKTDLVNTLGKLDEFKGLKTSEISMKTDEEYILDTKTTWPVSHIIKSEFIYGKTRLNITSTATFR